MECIVNQKKINIPIDKKPFGEGSEGKVYKINEEIYKISLVKVNATSKTC